MGRSHDLLLNRELSWLEFDRRVLEEAMDPSVPLLERLKFLSITSSNLDEFFMVRVGGLQQLLDEGKNRFDPAGMTTRQQLAEISVRTHLLVAEQAACFQQDIEPKLAAAGIRRLTPEQIGPEHVEYLERLFDREIYPILTPRADQVARRFSVADGFGSGTFGASETRQHLLAETAFCHRHAAQAVEPVHYRTRATGRLRLHLAGRRRRHVPRTLVSRRSNQRMPPVSHHPQRRLDGARRPRGRFVGANARRARRAKAQRLCAAGGQRAHLEVRALVSKKSAEGGQATKSTWFTVRSICRPIASWRT